MTTLRQTFADIADAIRAKGVSGTFKPIDMASKIGEIQAGGSEDYGYLTFTAEEDTTLTLKQDGIAPHKLLKSTDGVAWTKWENPSTNGISLNAGQSVYIKADEDALQRTANSITEYNSFQSTGSIKCSGDLYSLVKMVAPADYHFFFASLFKDCQTVTSVKDVQFNAALNSGYYSMFDGCSALVEGPSIMPATNLDVYCYQYMFQNCTSLTKAPELPATTLEPYCYSNMFKNCSALTTAPTLPATTLEPYCYQYMFQNCTSLTKPPALPATTTASYCYSYMFAECTSLVVAPELPATKLKTRCYQYMFQNCTSLTQPPALPATTTASYCYSYMFAECTSLVVGPELPAATCVTACYTNMFYNCTSLKRIKINASAGNWGTKMFDGCTSLELVDMTGTTSVPLLQSISNFSNTNNTYKIVVPDSLYETWIAATNWASIASHIMKQSDWNAAHPDDQL